MRWLARLVLFVPILGGGCSLLLNPDSYLEARDAAIGDTSRADAAGDGAPENRAPQLSGVGFSTYRPVLGSSLTAYPGPTYDPDGDAITLTYTWFHNEVMLDDARGPSLLLAPPDFQPDDRIRVEVRANDGAHDSDAAIADSATIQDNRSGWTMLAPPRHGDLASSLGFDPEGQRVLYWAQRLRDRPYDFGLWELQLRPEVGAGRWVQLHPSGAAPDVEDPATFYDPVGRRLVLFGGRVAGSPVASDAVMELSVQDRGSERWTDISIPTRPPARFAPSIANDPEGIYLYGGIGTGDVELDDLWRFDFASGSFTPIADELPDPRVGAVMLYDGEHEEGPRLILIGGGMLSGEGGEEDRFPLPGNAVSTIDLDSDSPTVTHRVDLPFPLLGGAGWIEGRDAHIVGGVDEVETGVVFSRRHIVIDLTTFAVSVAEVEGPAGQLLLSQAIDRAPFRSERLIIGRGAEGGRSEVFHFDASADPPTFTAEWASGITAPGPLMQATSTVRGGEIMLTGGRSTDPERPAVVSPTSWVSRSDGSWQALEIMSPGGGAPPPPQFGSVSDGSLWRWQHPSLFLVFGQRGAPDFGVESVVFRLNTRDPNRWHVMGDPVAHDAGNGEPAADLIGATIMPASCRNVADRENILAIYGGEAPGGVATTDTFFLNCRLNAEGPGPDRCEWFLVQPGGVAPTTTPPPLQWASSTAVDFAEGEFSQRVYLFGGMELPSETAHGGLWSMASCDSTASEANWSEVMNVGSPPVQPSARWGHTMNQAYDRGEVYPRNIVLFGGTDNRRGDGASAETWLVRPENAFGDGEERAQWEQVSLETALPPGRAFHAAIWDDGRGRLVVYGGLSEGAVLDDLWELRLR